MRRKFTSLQSVNRLTWIAVGLWTLIVGGSLTWNIVQEMQIADASALTTARANFFKDQSVRVARKMDTGFRRYDEAFAVRRDSEGIAKTSTQEIGT